MTISARHIRKTAELEVENVDELGVAQTNLNLDEGYIYGLNVTGNAGLQTAAISAGRARSAANDANIVVASPLTVTMTTTGANGRDAGSAVNAVWYVWVIRKSSDGTVAALASLSSTAPTMPSGYDQKRRVGTLVYFGSVVLGTQQIGLGNTRDTIFLTATVQANTFTVAAQALFDWSGRIPATAHRVNSWWDQDFSGGAGVFGGRVISWNNSAWSAYLIKDPNGVPSGSRSGGIIDIRPGGTREMAITSAFGSLSMYIAHYIVSFTEDV